MERDFKTLPEHWSIILDYLEIHPEILYSNLKPLGNSRRGTELWEELTLKLNGLGLGDRRADKWRSAIIRWKSKVKHKARALKRVQTRRGGGASHVTPLTELEKKLMSIICRKSIVIKEEVEELEFPKVRKECMASLNSPSPLCKIGFKWKYVSEPVRDFKCQSLHWKTMLAWMEKNPILLKTICYPGNRDERKREFLDEWEKLSTALNSLGLGERNSAKWRCAFSRWKSKIRNKAVRLSKNCPNTTPLTTVEERLLSLIKKKRTLGQELNVETYNNLSKSATVVIVNPSPSSSPRKITLSRSSPPPLRRCSVSRDPVEPVAYEEKPVTLKKRKAPLPQRSRKKKCRSPQQLCLIQQRQLINTMDLVVENMDKIADSLGKMQETFSAMFLWMQEKETSRRRD